MAKMSYFSQRDPRWSKEKIGESSLTVGRMGCCLTSISMLSSYFECLRLPSELAHNVHYYTKNGLVIWKNFVFSKMRFVGREYMRNDEKIREYLKDSGKAVIFEVDNRAHWVVGIKPTLLGNDYVIVDPWTGTKKTLKKEYKNITGAAYFAFKI